MHKTLIEYKIILSKIIVLILMSSCSSDMRDIDRGLIAWFPFNGNAVNMADSNCSILGEAILTADRFDRENSAYYFDGMGSVIWTTLESAPEYQSPQTISWWFYTDTLQTFAEDMGAGNMIVLVNPESGTGLQFGFRGPGYETKGFDVWKWGGGTILEIEQPSSRTWHHCAYTFDGKTHRFYMDGQEIKTSSESPQSGKPTILMFGNYPSGYQFLKGKLDDIRIYNRALASSEVIQLYK